MRRIDRARHSPARRGAGTAGPEPVETVARVGRTALLDAGDGPRVRLRAPGGAAGGASRPRRACSDLRVACGAAGAAADLARQRVPRAARPRARQPSRRTRLRLQERDAHAALRMAASLTAFWSVRGHFREGRQRLAEVLDLVPEENADRVAALNGAGWLAHDQGDLQVSTDLLDESVRLARAIHDVPGEGTALLNRARTALSGQDIGAAGADIEAALSILRLVARRQGGGCGLAVRRARGAVLRADRPRAGPVRGMRGTVRAPRPDHPARSGPSTPGPRPPAEGETAAGRAALAEGVPVVVESGDRFGIVVALGSLIDWPP